MILGGMSANAFNATFWSAIATILPVLLLAAAIQRQAITVVFGWIAQRDVATGDGARTSLELPYRALLAFMVVIGPLAVFGGLFGTFCAALALYRQTATGWMTACGWAGLCSLLLLNGIGLSSLHVKAVSDALEGSRIKASTMSSLHSGFIGGTGRPGGVGPTGGIGGSAGIDDLDDE